MADITPTGSGANTNIQLPEDDHEKEKQNNNADPDHRPQTNFGQRLKGRTLAARAGGIKQADSNDGSIMRNTGKNDSNGSQETKTAED